MSGLILVSWQKNILWILVFFVFLQVVAARIRSIQMFVLCICERMMKEHLWQKSVWQKMSNSIAPTSCIARFAEIFSTTWQIFAINICGWMDMRSFQFHNCVHLVFAISVELFIRSRHVIDPCDKCRNQHFLKGLPYFVVCMFVPPNLRLRLSEVSKKHRIFVCPSTVRFAHYFVLV